MDVVVGVDCAPCCRPDVARDRIDWLRLAAPCQEEQQPLHPYCAGGLVLPALRGQRPPIDMDLEAAEAANRECCGPIVLRIEGAFPQEPPAIFSFDPCLERVEEQRPHPRGMPPGVVEVS